MQKFQLFVSSQSGDLDPDLPCYVCVSNAERSSSDGLKAQREALEIGTAPYLGISTDHCFLDITRIKAENAESNTGDRADFSKMESVDLNILKSLGYDEASENVTLDDADIILPKPASWLDNACMTPTYKHVMWYWWHRRDRDFNILKDIFTTASPEYLADLSTYQNDREGFPLGTFLMRSDLYKDYTSWMLAVIDAYMQAAGLDENVSWVESLAPQIIARHLLAIYVHHLRRTRSDADIAYAPCRYFEHMDDLRLKPAFEENNVAVVLASDAAYAPLMSVTIESIVRNSSSVNNYDLVILDAGLTQADLEFIQQQTRGYDNFSLRVLHLRENLESRGLPTLAHITITTFARFLILEYMTSYSKVVYLDTDLVCTTDIAELYETDVSDYLVAAVRDTADAGWSNIVDNGTRDHLENVIELNSPYDYFNAGVLVMNIEALSQVTGCQKLIEMSLDKKWLWMDQDVLNHVCAGRVKYLDQAWNYMAHKEFYFSPETTPEIWLPVWMQNEYRAAHDDPKIVHYAGRATPCFSLYSDSAWYFWEYAKSSPYYEILVGISTVEMDQDAFNPIPKAREEKRRLAAVGPLVTIIVPVYNSARYLRELFDSLLRQTHENLEIVCVNDGSNDNSLELLNRYAAEDDRINIVDKENSGAGATRNAGLEHVHGKYVCFVDSDDFIEEDAIEQLVRSAEENKADVVVYGMDQYDDRTELFSPNPWAVSRSHIPSRKVFFAADIENFYKYLVGFTVNKLYLSSFLLGLNLKFPAIGAHEDMPFTYLALSASARTYYLDKTLYHYRRSREGSLSDTTSNRYIFMLEALMCLKNGLIERGLWADYQRNFVSYALHMCAWKHGELNKLERIEFRDTCRTTWFERLDMLEHDRDFFYDPDDYWFIAESMDMSLSRRIAAKYCRRKLSQSNRGE